MDLRQRPAVDWAAPRGPAARGPVDYLDGDVLPFGQITNRYESRPIHVAPPLMRGTAQGQIGRYCLPNVRQGNYVWIRKDECDSRLRLRHYDCMRRQGIKETPRPQGSRRRGDAVVAGCCGRALPGGARRIRGGALVSMTGRAALVVHPAPRGCAVARAPPPNGPPMRPTLSPSPGRRRRGRSGGRS